MGDQDQPHGTFAHQIANQLQDLPGDGDIQRRGGLVRDQQVGPTGQRHGNRDALALSAGKLVRPGVEAARGVRDTDAVEQGHRLLARGGRVQAAVQAQRLGHLVSDGVDRVEGRHGLLEDHADPVATQGAPAGLALSDHFLAVKAQTARGHGALGLQAHDCHGGQRLAAARLAHQSQSLTTAQREAHAAHGVHHAAMRAQTKAQVVDFQQGRGVHHGFSACGSGADRAGRAAHRQAGSVPALPARSPRPGRRPASGSGTAASGPR